MPKDYPSWSSPIISHRDVKAFDVEIKYIVFVPTEDVQPGPIYYSDVYTIPAGRRYFVSDCYGTTTFRGSIAVYIPGSHDIYTAFFEPYDTHFASLALPIPVESGETIRVSWQNTDRVPGTFRLLIGIWWEPGSPWIPPKVDDPLERFKTGDFNYAYYFLNEDGSFSVLFNKRKENKFNYLEIKNFNQSTQKILVSSKIKKSEAEKILDATHLNPKGKSKILKKIVEKYKK